MRYLFSLYLFFFISPIIAFGQEKTDDLLLFTFSNYSISNSKDNQLAYPTAINLNNRLIDDLLNGTIKTVHLPFQNDPSGFSIIDVSKKEDLEFNLIGIAQNGLGSLNMYRSPEGKVTSRIRISESGQVFLIIYDQELESYLLSREDINSDYLPEGEPLLKKKLNNKSAANRKNDALIAKSSPEQTSAGKWIIDILILYTAQALQIANQKYGADGINAAINLEMNDANLALANSEVDIYFRLAHSALVNFDESGVSSDRILDFLRIKDDGFLDSAHILRAQYGADIVSLFVNVEDTGGLAYRNSPGDYSYQEDLMFNLSRIRNWGSYTHAHEVGHNLGNAHGRNQNNYAAGSSGGRRKYSTGWKWFDSSNNGFVSVMNYSESGELRTPYYSNPNILYRSNFTLEDIPTGSYDPDNIYAPADNARSMNEVAEIVSGYFSSELTTTEAWINETASLALSNFPNELFYDNNYEINLILKNEGDAELIGDVTIENPLSIPFEFYFTDSGGLNIPGSSNQTKKFTLSPTTTDFSSYDGPNPGYIIFKIISNDYYAPVREIKYEFSILDNCPTTFNPNQEDADGDGIGDTCDSNFLPLILTEGFVMDENPVAGQVIGTIEFQDQDTDQQYSFSIASNDYADIDSETGEITVKDNFLFNYEAIQNISLLVYVSDGVETASKSINIQLVDLNDTIECSNSIESSKGKWTIIGTDTYGDGWNEARIHILINGVIKDSFTLVESEGYGPKAMVFDYQQDIGVISFSFQKGEWDDEIGYEIFSPNATLIAKSYPSDSKSEGEIDLLLCSDFDNDGVEDRIDNCRATSNPNQEDIDADGIGNICDSITNFLPLILTEGFVMDENPVAGQVIGTIEFQDQDTDQQYSFSIASNDYADIDSETGEITVKDNFLFNYEAIQNISLLVYVSDGVETASKSINIQLVDLNDTIECSNSIESSKGKWTIIGTDTYGDGWNEARIHILINGVIKDSFTLVESEGYGPKAMVFDYQQDIGVISFSFQKGEWDDEIGYEIFSPNGTLIAKSYPSDSKSDGEIDLLLCSDFDNDGVEDRIDNCIATPNPNQEDNDGDGIGDTCDEDSDNDGFSDSEEIECGTDPLDKLSYPLDQDEDGLHDCIDEDDDNDGFSDEDEGVCGTDPLDDQDVPTDTDQDTIADCIDDDDDGDGYLDDQDVFPLDSSEWSDFDQDGVGDNADTDDDNDGFSDEDEGVCGTDPLDDQDVPTDTDQDTIADCIDDDDDGDGYLDDQDVFPLDSSEWLDFDQDGVGDNADTDDDNDSILDTFDECPNSSQNIIVDARGCEVVFLSENTFSIAVTDVTCSGESNGKIEIVTQNTDYTFNYSLNNSPNQVLNPLQILEDLSSGVYNLCFSIEGNSNIKRCYVITVNAPTPLDVSSIVDINKNKVRLQLGGSSVYSIKVNNKNFSTKESYFEIELEKGNNTISVIGDSECQGEYLEDIFISEEVKIYPNPNKGIFNIYFSGEDSKAILTLFSASGIKMNTIEALIPKNRIYKYSLEGLPKGLYLLKIKGDFINSSQKIIVE